MKERIGFMQGRLSPMVDGKIQAFPWACWRNEFLLAQENGFQLIEWTLEQERLYENPLMTPDGQKEVTCLQEKHNVRVASLTGDCFMQAPFWKTDGDDRKSLQNDFIAIVTACSVVGIQYVVVPLVDNGRLDRPDQSDILVNYLLEKKEFFIEKNVKIIFESDFAPEELAGWIQQLDADVFGINYDSGNSAALGYKANEELAAYGERVVNVHIKDRVLNGTTVPLGEGDADFETVFSSLASVGYSGNYILQTARATDEDHVGALRKYRTKLENWLK